MAKGFTIRRVGHVGIQVTDVDRSIEWYRDILGLTLTGRWPMGESGAMAFMRFTDDHHNIVLFTHPTPVTEENRHAGYNALQHIALEVADRLAREPQHGQIRADQEPDETEQQSEPAEQV